MVPHCRPFLAPNQEKYVLDAMRRGDLVHGEYVERLEDELSRMCGGHAVCVSSGTAGLVMAMELSRKVRYRMPALTYVAPAQAARLWGAWPVFVDIDPATWGAVGPVDLQIHLYGTVAPGAAPIEDACEALGAWKLSGRFGVLSFNQNKIATGGGGGAVLCQYEPDAAHIRHLIGGARVRGPAQVWDAVGWPFEMTNMQAAIACAQLEVLDTTILRKEEIAARYQDELPIAFLVSTTYWQPVGLLQRPALPVVEACQADGIDVRMVWPCLADLPLFSQCETEGDLPVARHVAKHGISLPCSPDMTEDEQARVIEMVRKYL